jgi:CPA2 family monovalent cation:H+ antiporter-2
MLFDPHILVQEPLRVLAVTAIIMIGKTVAAVALVLLFRYPLNTALTVGAGLAQIGEFSFILAGLGVSLGLLSREGQDLILAGALISIALNAALFAAIEPAQAWIRQRSSFARKLEQRDDPLAELPVTVDPAQLAGQVVIVGYGRVGSRIAEALRERLIPFVIAEQNREIVEKLRAQGIAAVSGDAMEPDVLVQAHIARAAMMVVAIPETFAARQMIDTARTLNPGIEIVIRTHSEDDAQLFEREHLGTAFLGEHELARGMTAHVLERMGKAPGAAASASSHAQAR